MPFESEAQRRAMYAAAEGKSNIGIPKSVGEKFIKHAHDSAELTKCAGILFQYDGKVLLLHRSDRDEWEGPGGHIEDGESEAQAARREAMEEIGRVPSIKVSGVKTSTSDSVHYTTFLADVSEAFDVALNDEHDDSGWFALDELPESTHPGVLESLGVAKTDSRHEPKGVGKEFVKHDSVDIDRRIGDLVKKGFSRNRAITIAYKDAGKAYQDAGMNELDAAKAVRDGSLPSPSRFGNFHLFDVRITGTGVAYRDYADEYSYRDPKIFLSDEFVERCNGLPLIFEHTDANTLNSEEFRQRIIGIVILPYVKNDEVWGIAKVFDDDGAVLMQNSHASTSPNVVFRDGGSNETIEIDGKTVLIEGNPDLLDHLAICKVGVWDKGGEPRGINNGDQNMADMKEEEKVPAWADSLMKRMDALEKKDGRKDSEAEAETEKRQAAELEKLAKEEREEGKKEEKKDCKKDESHETEAKSEKREKDGEFEKKDAKKDAEGEGEKEAEKAAEGVADKSRADSASKETRELRAMLEQMNQQLSVLTKPLSHSDRDALAASQARADATYQLMGARASAPLAGETPLSYRKRLADGLKKYSTQFKAVPLENLDGPVFETIESQIYADAVAFSKTPEVSKPGVLIPVVRRDSAGREITEYPHGDIDAWLNHFKSPGRVGKFNRDEIHRAAMGI